MPGEGCEALMGGFSLMAGLAAGASFFRLMTLKWSVLNLIITAPLFMVEPSLGDWISMRGVSAAKAAITAHRTNAIGRTNLADNLDISLLLLRELGWEEREEGLRGIPDLWPRPLTCRSAAARRRRGRPASVG